ncbi:MAG TPA: tetratricopeptide repeat protein [Verrucomicrobiales bacterium]|nr:tetratricopeptide repeat protein [Verrucomicrobiales bacterium]
MLEKQIPISNSQDLGAKSMFGSLFANKEKLKSLFITAWQQNNMHRAIKMGEKLVAKDPENFENIHDLGMVHFQAGLLVPALQYLTTANKIQENAINWNNIGRVQQAMKNFEQARSSYDRSRELDTDDPQPWFNVSVCYREEGDMQAAFDELKKITKVYPDHLSTLSDLALHFEQHGQIDKAIELFEKALAVDSEYNPARENLILMLCDQGETERVAKQLDFYKQKGIAVEIKMENNKISTILINGFQFYSN